jgi:hypothetical protein
MEYDRERAWEAQPDMTREPLDDEEPVQWPGDRRAGERDDAEFEDSDHDYEEWLAMDFYFAGYSRGEAKKMAHEQLKRERAWRERHPAD